MKFKKNFIVMGICSLMVLCTSCDTAMAVLAGMADTMNSCYTANTTTTYTPTTNTYYPTTYTTTTSSNYSSSSSSSTICSRCGGTGRCKTCDGAGKVYDWGPNSVISKEKYWHKCGVCNGKGTCGVCH